MASVALGWLALWLNGTRDYAGGRIAARQGHARAPHWVGSTLTVRVRLQRSTLIGWVTALSFLGAMLGSVLANLDKQLAGTAVEDFARRHGGAVGEVFFQFVLYVLAQIATAAALATVLSLRADETGGLAEPVLAQPVTRTRWALSVWTIAGSVGAVILLGLGVGAALTSVRWTLPLTTIAYLPAALAVIGLALALVGWLPRAAVPVSWTVLALLLLLDLFAEFNLLPAAVVSALSPFAATFTGLLAGGLPIVLITLTLIGLGLAFAGLIGLRRRDLELS